MDSTLSYATPRPAGDVVGRLLMVLGAAVLLMGVGFGVMTWDMLRRQVLPGAEWGPRQYVIRVLEAFVWITVLLNAAGVAALLVGFRRVRRRPLRSPDAAR